MPDFLHESVESYLDKLASGDAVPGGGSAAGLAGAMAAALLCMAARFTMGRPRYVAYQETAERVLASAETLRVELQGLVERDAEAYARYGAANALPKGNEAEKATRHAAIQSATQASADAPMAIARACVQLLVLAEQMSTQCNPHLVSDVAVATELALSGFHSAVLNVRINLQTLDDGDVVALLVDELRRPNAQAPALATAALEQAYGLMQLSREGV